ncbi:MAG: hypothetical protein AABM40_12360 [Chloroflexota bacterium]
MGPEVAPQDRVDPDGRLVQKEQARVVEEGRSQRDPGPHPAGERRDDRTPPIEKVNGA